uniref:Zn(2)-C6 fungal-type domain-containing protein n=1 Tax=Mycena chlorophos TaxID=658473 RepID=A0ABQ0L824_MYCCL|nr:predicted protein [Mycena chlorophos]
MTDPRLGRYPNGNAFFPVGHDAAQWQQQPYAFSYEAMAPGAQYDELFAQYPHQQQPQYSQYASYPQHPTIPAYPGPVVPPTTQEIGPSRKRQRIEEPPAEMEEGTEAVGAQPGVNTARLTAACSHCRKLKMKCEFSVDADGEMEDACRRCQATGHKCTFEERRQRRPPNKAKYLMEQIRQKDEMIETLLKQLHNPYTATPLAIASFERALGPSDRNDVDVVTWLSQMQASGAAPGTAVGGAASDSPANNNDVMLPTSNPDHVRVSVGTVSSGLPDPTAPVGVIANLSLTAGATAVNSPGPSTARRVPANAASDRDAGGNTDSHDASTGDSGVANAMYFKPGPATDLKLRAKLIERHTASLPELILHGIVTTEDVEGLFEIFHAQINPFVGLLDSSLHTPESTFARCPFLHTVVCAIASRYSPEKAKIYPLAMHFAKQSAASAVIDGWKSVELCQAFVLLALYASPTPSDSWEEDRAWVFAGLALRLATDLGLDKARVVGGAQEDGEGDDEERERESLNRTRTWIVCCLLDRSMAIQFGRSETVKEEDIAAHGVEEWYSASPQNSSYDVHLCAYTQLVRLTSRFRDEIVADPAGLDWRGYEALLGGLKEEWVRRTGQIANATERENVLRRKLFYFRVAYSRLVMYSLGLQLQQDQVFVVRSLESAKEIIRIMLDDLRPTGFMLHSPDEYFTIVAFAAAFILKLLVTDRLPAEENEARLIALITRLVETLSSSEISLDERHVPRQYARFLSSVLARHRQRRNADRMAAAQAPMQPPPAQQQTITPSTSGDYSHLGLAFGAPDAGVAGLEHGYAHGYAPMGQPQFALLPNQEQLFAAFGWWDESGGAASGHDTAALPMDELQRVFARPGGSWNWFPVPPPASSRHSPTSEGSAGSWSPLESGSPLNPTQRLQPLVL